MIDIAYADGSALYDGIRISRAGHIFAQEGREINRPFGRDDYLLFYVAAGSESFLFESGQATAEAGDFVIFAPGEPQRHICEYDGTSEFYYVHFECSADRFRRLYDGGTSTVSKIATGEDISAHFQDILSELQLELDSSHEIAVTRLTELFLRIKRGVRPKKSALSTSQVKTVHKIIHGINKSWSEPYTLDDYAREFCLSRYHLAHIFKKYTGISLIAYRNRLRLRYAKGMLEKTDLSIAEIAENVGFAGQQYFCEAFKESFGVSPSEYRRAERK